MKAIYVIIVALGTILISCVKKEFDLDSLRAARDYSTEEARDVDITYSDSAVLRVRIQAPLLRRYVYRFRVEEEFPEGVHVTFYDMHARPSSWLTAKYAIRLNQEHKTIVRDSVVLYNTRGEKLTGLELIWDENAETISSDQFVKITRGDEVVLGQGFVSNPDFTKYTIYAVEGDVLFDEPGVEDAHAPSPVSKLDTLRGG